MTPDPYAEIAELYDLEHAGFNKDLGLYLNLCKVVGDPILELGCGSGRILLPLAAAGYRVTGVDRSQAMLDRAKVAAERAGIDRNLRLHPGDMTRSDSFSGGPFGLVIISLNCLMHVASLEGQRQALTAARRALDPRGMLVVDVLSPDPELLATFDGRVQLEGSWAQSDGRRVDRFASRTHAPAEQMIHTELWFDLTDHEGRVQRVRTRFPMRYVHRAELELLLELAGFVEWQIYGSYELDPFTDLSDRLIVTAEATSSAAS